MRILYLCNLVGVGAMAFPALLAPAAPLADDPMRAVALSFWGALALLSLLGLRYPVRMLPVLLLQFLYKLVWIGAVLLPAWMAGAVTPDLAGFAQGMVIGILFDIAAIPWLFAIRHYLAAPGERWRQRRAAPRERLQA